MADVVHYPGSTALYAGADDYGKDFMKVSLHSSKRRNRRGASRAHMPDGIVVYWWVSPGVVDWLT